MALAEMRPISELRIREEGDGPLRRGAPSDDLIHQFEREFCVVLPPDYVAFLRLANGGAPDLSYVTSTKQEVRQFYGLYGDHSLHDIFPVARYFSDWLEPGLICFGCDYSNNQYLMNLNIEAAPVGFFHFAADKSIDVVAASFSEFLDLLAPDPDTD